MTKFLLPLACMVALVSLASAADLKPGVRGLATRAPAGMKIDGDLAEFKDAFSHAGRLLHGRS